MTNRMRALAGLGTIVVLACLIPPHARAQGIARRIEAVHDGKVRMSFAARPDICGFENGIANSSSHFSNNWRSRSRDSNQDVVYDDDCSRGPARVVLTLDAGRVSRVRAYIGGRWAAASGVTDLGTVPVREAVDYLFGVANSQSGTGAGEAIFAATLADSVQIVQPLMALVQNESRPRDVREKAIFWLGQTGSPEVSQYLRTLYSRLRDEDLKDKVIFAISQRRDDESAKWLVDLAGNQSESMDMRRKALFWSGQNEESLDRLVSMYDRMKEREMKEQMIFVFSQRKEHAAIDKLMSIAKSDPDRDMRRKAMFWLGQSRDERVAAFLTDMLSR